MIAIETKPHLWAKMSDFTCFDCIYAKVHSNFVGSLEEPPEEGYAECLHPNYKDAQEEEGEEYAQNCSGFSPILVGNCYNCGTHINHPLYKGWAFKVYCNYSGDPIFACSQSCLDQLVQQQRNDATAFAPLQGASNDTYWSVEMEQFLTALEGGELD